MGELLRGGAFSECFSFIKDWVEKKVRRHLAYAQKRKGFDPLKSPETPLGWGDFVACATHACNQWMLHIRSVTCVSRRGAVYYWRLACHQALLEIAAEFSSVSGPRKARRIGAELTMMSEELFEQAKQALLRPDEVKARCGPSNIADIRRRLSNSRMRCSCSVFDTLLVATAKGKALTAVGCKWLVGLTLLRR
jgi:hypothetical protein